MAGDGGVRAAVSRGQRLQVEEWPRPAVGQGEMLLRLKGCGLCGSDIVKLGPLHGGPRTGLPSPPDVRSGPAPAGRSSAIELVGPMVLGHELVGDVVEIGGGVGGFAVGDRAVAAHHVPFGACHYLVSGDISVDGLITHRLPLERLEEGVDLMRRHLAVKVLVTP